MTTRPLTYRTPLVGGEKVERTSRPAAIVHKVDEAGLLKRARAGDEDAFSHLYSLHQRAIYRYAMYMCGAAEADDVVQEAFMALLRLDNSFDASRGTVGGYLFGIARHVVLKRLGSRFGHERDDFDADASTALSPDVSVLDVMTQQETIDAVRAGIASLPPRYREVIALCDLQEMDYLTAAALLECPVGTVRSRLHRARTLLADKLSALRRTSQAS